MEKKRWVLILMALCLALVFSVSSVEAQDICFKGEFCDRDEDGFPKDHNRCVECLGVFETEFDCDDSDNSDENDCAEIESGTTFSVVLLEPAEPPDPPSESPWVLTLGNCVGRSSSSNLGAGFSFPIKQGCGQVIVTRSDFTEVELWLSQISVKNTKKGATVNAFFNADCCPNHSENPDVYATDNLSAVVQATDVDDASFEIDVGALDVNLRKIHQPNRGEIVGTISIGRMVYTAQ